MNVKKRWQLPVLAVMTTLAVGAATPVAAQSPAPAAVEDPSEVQGPDYTGIATVPVNEATLPEDETAETAVLAGLATTTRAEAESAALAAQPGTVSGAQLESENGFVVWSVIVVDSSGVEFDVKVDAGTGMVLGMDDPSTEAGDTESGDEAEGDRAESEGDGAESEADGAESASETDESAAP